jgi:hypothetical protein
VLLPSVRERETTTVSHAAQAKRAVWSFPCIGAVLSHVFVFAFMAKKQITMSKSDKVKSTIEVNSNDISAKCNGSDKLISFHYDGLFTKVGIKQLIYGGVPHGGMVMILKSKG